MPNIFFTHKLNSPKTLVVETGAEEISWAYNLNTVAYPTYGGEVVQVLSANIDNISIRGQIRSYEKMEEIYKWFVEYFMLATQGTGSGKRFKEEPVTMEYPHRGWKLSIQPLALPGMRYGRDVVVPEWSMQAHVVDPDPEQDALALDAATRQMVQDYHSPAQQLKQWESHGIAQGQMNAAMYREGNPFSDPMALITAEEQILFFRDQKTGQEIPVPEGISVEGSGKRAKQIAKGDASANFDYMNTWPENLGKQMHGQFMALVGGNQAALEFFGEASGPSTTSNNDTQDKKK